MKDTVKIWTAFEQEFKTFPMPPGVEIIAFESYKAAYAQGRRDLIQAMGEPVAWMSEYKGFMGCTTHKDLAEKWAKDKTQEFYPLYRLPEDTPK